MGQVLSQKLGRTLLAFGILLIVGGSGYLLYSNFFLLPQYGYVDLNGNVVIKARYDFACSFSEGLAAVKVNGKWGYIDQSGKFAISPQFEGTGKPVSDFSEGVASAYKNGKLAFIDRGGRVVLDVSAFDDVGPFHDGLAVVKQAKKLGYINKKGEIVIEPQFLDDPEFSGEGRSFFDGLAAFKSPINKKYGYIDKTGKPIIDPQFEFADRFSEGLAAVEINGRIGFIDKSGKIVIEPQFEALGRFSDGLFPTFNPSNQKYGYIDRVGRLVINYQFIAAFNFSQGVARVHPPDFWTTERKLFINRAGQIVFEPNVNVVRDFSEGFAVYLNQSSGKL